MLKTHSNATDLKIICCKWTHFSICNTNWNLTVGVDFVFKSLPSLTAQEMTSCLWFASSHVFSSLKYIYSQYFLNLEKKHWAVQVWNWHYYELESNAREIEISSFFCLSLRVSKLGVASMNDKILVSLFQCKNNQKIYLLWCCNPVTNFTDFYCTEYMQKAMYTIELPFPLLQ